MTAMQDSIGLVPTPDVIRSAIDRITASEVFSRSPQLGAFLRFVVEAVLEGKASRIKAYTIGVEVLRRDPNFDPQLDPIVRVEATRLRRAIERYYAGPGVSDPVLIDLPRGTYVPTFRHREAGAATSPKRGVSFRMLMARPAFAGAALALTIVIGGLLLSPIGQGGSTLVRDMSGNVGRPLPPGNGMPAVSIEPIRMAGDVPAGGLAPETLRHKVGDAFARFDTINVVDLPSPSRASSLPADYRLSGTVEYRDGQTSAHFRLTDAAENNVVWTRSFERIAAGDTGRAEDEIAGALAGTLLQSFGVIRSRDRAKHLVSNAGDPRYRCILEAADSLRTLSRDEHLRSRSCLERFTAADPSFAVGYAFLAMLYGREHHLGLAAQPGEAPALERALRAVRRSIELNPASARPYVVLMLVLFQRGELAEAFAAGEKAIALNKYDPLALAEYGGRLIMVGDAEKGLAMLRRAGEFGAIRPAWQHFYMFLGAYLSNDLQEAAFQAGQITADNYPAGHLARTLLAVAAGDVARAREAADRLVALQPGWRQDCGRELAKLSPSPQVRDRLAGDLAKAGLDVH